jgi:hypothetical protein
MAEKTVFEKSRDGDDGGQTVMVQIHREDPEPDRIVMIPTWREDPSPERTYITAARIISDEELRERQLAEAARQLKGWRKRFADLEELAEVFSAIDNLEVTAGT